MTVADLRRWTDLPKPMGLLPDVQDLIILVYAEQSNRAIRGGMGTPKLGNLSDGWKLVQQQLPDEADWTEACKRGGLLFGVAGSPYRTASNVDKFVSDVKAKAGASAEVVRSLAARLREHASVESNRLGTATSADALLRAIDGTSTPVAVVKAITVAQLHTSADAVARHIATASSVLSAIESVNWPLIDGLKTITDEPRATAAQKILEDVEQALSDDQYVTDLVRVLRGAVERATALIIGPKRKHNDDDEGKVRPRTGRRTVPVAQLQSVLDEIRQSAEPDEQVTLTWEIE
jgi:hypothetical protein